MSNFNFIRTWRLTFKRDGIQTLQFTNIGIDFTRFTPHRIIFNCNTYGAKGDPCAMSTKIYNISQNDRENIRVNDDIYMEAGYSQNGFGLIFSGKVQSFYGLTELDGNDFNYVYNIYSISYFQGGNIAYTVTDQQKPQSINLSQSEVGEPFTIGAQALLIGQKFGYTPQSSAVSQSLANQPGIPMIATGINMYMMIDDFDKKSGACIALNPVTKTYALVPSIPTKQTYNDLAKTLQAIPIDRNNGLIDYPLFDPTTGYVKIKVKMNSNITAFNTTLKIDLSNTQLENVEKSQVQTLVTAYREYKTFMVYSLEYIGDTRGSRDDWRQNILAFGNLP